MSLQGESPTGVAQGGLPERSPPKGLGVPRRRLIAPQQPDRCSLLHPPTVPRHVFCSVCSLGRRSLYFGGSIAVRFDFGTVPRDSQASSRSRPIPTLARHYNRHCRTNCCTCDNQHLKHSPCQSYNRYNRHFHSQQKNDTTYTWRICCVVLAKSVVTIVSISPIQMIVAAVSVSAVRVHKVNHSTGLGAGVTGIFMSGTGSSGPTGVPGTFAQS